MKKLTILAFAMLMMLFASCSKDDLNVQNNQEFIDNPELVCSTDATKPTNSYNPEDGTKTTLTLNGESNYEITWDAKDEIAVTDGTKLAYYQAVSAGEKTSVFVCKSGDKLDLTKELVAAYPSNLIKKEEGKIVYSMDVVNKVSDITSIHNYPMMAKGRLVDDEIKMVFRNVGSIVRLKVSRNNPGFTDQIKINSLEVTTDKAVAGEFSVSWTVGSDGVSVPTIKMSDDEDKTSKMIKFSGFEKVLPEEGSVTLCAVIAPETYSNFQAMVGAKTTNTTAGTTQSGYGYIKLKAGKTISLLRSNYYDITKSVSLEFIDLNPAAATSYRNCTGNCLMISVPGAVGEKGQYYAFSVLCNGNHFWRQFGPNSDLRNSNIKDEDWNNMIIHDDKAGHVDEWVVEIIWQDRYNNGKPLIQFLGTEYGELSVKYHGFRNLTLRAVAYGNTVIGLRRVINGVKQPFSWSFHVWAFNGNFDEFTIRHDLHGLGDQHNPKLMRLNLGAMDVNDPGLYYQHGRKDPFPNPDNYYKANVADGTITKSSFEVETLPTQCKNGKYGTWVTVTHPGRFYSDWCLVTEMHQSDFQAIANWLENKNWTFDQPGHTVNPNFKQPLFEPTSLGLKVPDNHTYEHAQWRCSSGKEYYKILIRTNPNLEEKYPKSGYLSSSGVLQSHDSYGTYYWMKHLANEEPTAWAGHLAGTSTTGTSIGHGSDSFNVHINPSRGCHIRAALITTAFDPQTYQIK